MTHNSVPPHIAVPKVRTGDRYTGTCDTTELQLQNNGCTGAQNRNSRAAKFKTFLTLKTEPSVAKRYIRARASRGAARQADIGTRPLKGVANYHPHAPYRLSFFSHCQSSNKPIRRTEKSSRHRKVYVIDR